MIYIYFLLNQVAQFYCQLQIIINIQGKTGQKQNMASIDKNTLNQQINIHNSSTPLKATSSFVSKNQRFAYKSNKLPGPGAYEYKEPNFKTHQYHVPKDRTANSDVKKQHMWIWGSTRTSYINNKSASVLGPGAYNYHESMVVNGNHTNWGKSNRFSSQLKNTSVSNPGPGQYEQEKKTSKVEYKNSFGSVFLSKSPKTFMQKLYSQTSTHGQNKKTMIEDLVQHLNPQIIKENRSLDKSKFSEKSQQFNHKHNTSVFASKIPRFSPQKSEVNIGPGSYQIPLSSKKSKQKLPKIISVQSQDRTKKIKQKKQKDEKPTPGPGSYDHLQKTIQKSVEDNQNCTIDRQQRFLDKVEARPGPGHYMQNKYQFISDSNKERNKLIGNNLYGTFANPPKPSFGSSAIRDEAQPKNTNPFGNYNVDIYDIQYKMKKRQEHLQKLNIMEVTLPAFETKHKSKTKK